MLIVEDDYLDVLQNTQIAIIRVCREHPELLDAEVDKVLNTAVLEYQAEQPGRNSSRPTPGGLADMGEGHVKHMANSAWAGRHWNCRKAAMSSPHRCRQTK